MSADTQIRFLSDKILFVTKTLSVKAVKLVKTGVELRYQITKLNPCASVQFLSMVLSRILLQSPVLACSFSGWYRDEGSVCLCSKMISASRSLEEEEEEKEYMSFN